MCISRPVILLLVNHTNTGKIQQHGLPRLYKHIALDSQVSIAVVSVVVSMSVSVLCRLRTLSH